MALFLVTEEAFIHATFLEFVKLWVNGSQAFLQVQCHNGQAWIQLMSALGPPSAPHLFRQDHHHHGYHGPHSSYQRKMRRKGAKQRDRGRARADLYRASLLETDIQWNFRSIIWWSLNIYSVQIFDVNVQNVNCSNETLELELIEKIYVIPN